jgi:hypothetical protein
MTRRVGRRGRCGGTRFACGPGGPDPPPTPA